MLWVTNSCYIQKQQLLLIRRLNNRRGLNLSPRDAPSKCRETSCTSGPPAGPWMCLCALLPWRFYNWSDTDWVVYTPPDLVLQALPSRVPHLFCLMEQFHIRQNLADFFSIFPAAWCQTARRFCGCSMTFLQIRAEISVVHVWAGASRSPKLQSQYNGIYVPKRGPRQVH